MQNVAEATVTAMVNQLGCQPQNIIAVIGPAIGPCCYEVGPEVMAAGAKNFADSATLFIHTTVMLITPILICGKPTGDNWLPAAWGRQFKQKSVQPVIQMSSFLIARKRVAPDDLGLLLG